MYRIENNNLQDKKQIDYGIVGDCYDYDHVLEEIKRQAD